MSEITGNDNSAILEQVAMQSDQLYFIFDYAAGRIQYLNDAFGVIWERDPKEVLDNPALLLDTIHPDDRAFVQEQYQKITGSCQALKSKEFRILVPDGRIKWVCLSAYCIMRNGRLACISGSVEDITKRKDYMANLVKYGAKKNSMLEILSHDLASPLNTIHSVVGLLERKIKQYNDPVITELLNFIRSSCQQGSDLIRDFVQQEFLESAQVALNVNRIDMREKLHVILEDYRKNPQLVNKRFELQAPDAPVYAEVDEVKFIQALQNLISNAIKFTPDDGIITVSLSETDDHLEFMVQDNGIGIPEEMQPQLFEKFTPARRAGLRGEKSTGLGMSIIKTIVDMHRGTIRFVSEEGKGSSFYITIAREQR
jgi:two-component system, OmpR family, sensor histidine kinase VicK